MVIYGSHEIAVTTPFGSCIFVFNIDSVFEKPLNDLGQETKNNKK